ncbi:Na+/H+ antiporter [Curtobacterium sp. ISL-83]|uniref:Na+/H+ antiporter n=1 Tax=Curtobacterium sp. ISL-83 TaxID=2819145 RepID=UPI001BEBD4CE|nr:Na+/H+ antiporter [Curtobacterium sp. ISL-83]MBT2501707.1 Na+/H+ antiporter [Curtobacterium sp. ISL-83]
MLGLEIVVVLGTAVLVCSGLARRFRLAPPILLLTSGILLGFVPALRAMQLPPEVVLFLFLPVLLFWESLTTSLREIRANLRGIVLTSTVLVAVTAAAVAFVAHLLGMPWGPAWVLGAAVAPTDATAVGSFTRDLPRRTVTTLRAESLVNDGTALVIYGLAVAVVAGNDNATPVRIGWLVVLAYGGGALIGFVLAWVVRKLRNRIDDPLQETVLTILTPFVAYLVAESVGSSGVLAVVISGLALSQVAPRRDRAAARRKSNAFWSLLTFLLNASLFVLVGLQLQSAVRALNANAIMSGLVSVAIVSVALIVVRIAFLFLAAYAIRAIDRRPQQRLRRISNRARILSGLSGFRGAVSLAAALGVPLVLSTGEKFPDRDVIVFITSGVIVVTLVVQGLLLPTVVRWAALPRDSAVSEERRLAELTATEHALIVLPEVARDLQVEAVVEDRARRAYEAHLRLIRSEETEGEDEEVCRDRQYRLLRAEIVNRKREAVVQLRDDKRIDDTVLRQVEANLDIEEIRLLPRETD